MFAQGATGLLIQLFDLICHRVAHDHAHGFGQAKGETACQTRQGFVTPHRQHRFKPCGNFAINEMLQTARDLFTHIIARLIIDKGCDSGALGLCAFDQLAHGRVAPHQTPLGGKVQFGVWRIIKPICAQMQFGAQGLHCGGAQSLRRLAAFGVILHKAEPIQTASEFAFYRHFALVIHLGHEGLLLFQSPQQQAGAAIYKSLRKRAMQRVG